MFPDGRFVPRWTAWAAILLGLPALLYFSPDAMGFETHTTNNATTTIIGIDAGALQISVKERDYDDEERKPGIDAYLWW